MLLEGVVDLDLVVLNAGVLGGVNSFVDVEYRALLRVMDVNVWSNKIILDFLFRKNIKVKQVIAISSGASQHTYKGWGPYSISKTAFRMMIDVYAKEHELTHFISIAPGLIDTKMQDYLCNQVDINKFPVIQKFVEARESGNILSPDVVAKRIVGETDWKQLYESGSYVDLRGLY